MKKQRAALLGSALLISITASIAGCSDTPTGLPANTVAPSSNGATTNQGNTPTKAQSQLTSISLRPSNLVMAPGAKQAITVTATFKDGSTKELPVNTGISVQSSDPAVATVDNGGVISITPQAKTGTSITITASYQGQTTSIPLTVKYALADTITTAANGSVPAVTNPTDIAVVVNKTRALPNGYTPDKDLVEPNILFSFKEKNEKRLLRTEAARALEKLFAQAAKDNIKLAGVSAYRSYASQKAIWESNVRTQGEKLASQYSARPGTSEHQTGLAIDVSSPSVKYALEESFGATPEAKWLAANAPKYGFIIRYPKGKESITGYNYEPWHIRYVGVDIAMEISEKGITLEEYFQDAVPVVKQKQ